MKRVLQILFVSMFLFGGANAQMIDLMYYQPEMNYTLVGLQPGSMTITRFKTEYPAKLHEISFWPHTEAAAGDSVNVYVFGREGGGAYPVLLYPLITGKMFVPGGTNTLIRIPFDPQPTFDLPTTFFVAVQPLGENVKVRMDNYRQTPNCATSEADTMYTNSYWMPLQPPYIPFSSRFQGNVAIKNWYVGAMVEYFKHSPETMFTDATLIAGLNVPPDGQRVAWADFNDDGYQDLLYGGHLFRNNGNGTFMDVASSVGYSEGSEVQMLADVDNDGDLDIVCQPKELIYFNDEGAFTKDDMPGFSPGKNTQAMSFADYDGDGYIDLFVANGEYMYRQNPQVPGDSALVKGAAWEAYMYGNTQNGHFRDIKSMVLGGYRSGAYGRDPYNPQQIVQGYRPITGVQWVDIDGDGDMDIYACNNRLQPNYFFKNQGNGFFQESALTHKLQGFTKTNPDYLGLYGNSRGCDFADYDNDGDMDLLVGENMEQFRLGAGDPTAVWTNSGKPLSVFSIVNPGVSHLRFDLWNADASWGDFNNDGLLDLMITPGEKCVDAALYLQNPDRSFTNVTFSAGINVMASLGLAWVDYDNDGDLDLSLATETGLKLYRNDMAEVGNWVAFNLRSRTSNIYAIGATIRVYAGGQIYMRTVVVGEGAGSQQPYVQHVGIGTAAAIDSVTVLWPNGTGLSLTDVEINKIHDITEEPPVSVAGVPVPGDVTLQQNYPNPFSIAASAVTSIGYTLAVSSDVTVEIYDSRGALVRSLVASDRPSGAHQLQWNGMDRSGRKVASGTYTYVLSAAGQMLSRQLIVVK